MINVKNFILQLKFEMAVKHKTVKYVATNADSPLTILLRVLQDIHYKRSLKDNEVGKVCEKIVFSLGSLVVPTNIHQYLRFITEISSLQDMLIITFCTNEELIFAALKAFYDDISNSEKLMQPTVAIILQLINVKSIPTVVKWILDCGYSKQNLEQSLMTLCRWLTRWTLTPNLGLLVFYFVQGLEAEQHCDILVNVTLSYVEQLFQLFILPDHRKNVGPIVQHMLSKNQHNPEIFHKVIPHVDKVLSFLKKENTESSSFCIQVVVNMCVTLMEHFPNYPRIYDPLRHSLEPFQPAVNYSEVLNCKSWSDEIESRISLYAGKNKVGLNNLGNTCYMNSVLQALFMTKLFRNDLLLADKLAVPLLSELQILFTLLQYSRRSALSPSRILALAEPSGFQYGQQHDSSEFLGYLLDTLHEQEHSIYSLRQSEDTFLSGWYMILLILFSFIRTAGRSRFVAKTIQLSTLCLIRGFGHLISRCHLA